MQTSSIRLSISGQRQLKGNIQHLQHIKWASQGPTKFLRRLPDKQSSLPLVLMEKKLIKCPSIRVSIFRWNFSAELHPKRPTDLQESDLKHITRLALKLMFFRVERKSNLNHGNSKAWKFIWSKGIYPLPPAAGSCPSRLSSHEAPVRHSGDRGEDKDTAGHCGHPCGGKTFWNAESKLPGASRDWFSSQTRLLHGKASYHHYFRATSCFQGHNSDKLIIMPLV